MAAGNREVTEVTREEVITVTEKKEEIILRLDAEEAFYLRQILGNYMEIGGTSDPKGYRAVISIKDALYQAGVDYKDCSKYGVKGHIECTEDGFYFPRVKGD